MPIIPKDWTGTQTVNAINTGTGTGNGSPIFQFVKSVNITINELDTFIDLVGYSTEAINKEFSLDVLSGKVKLYWKNLNNSYSLVHHNDLSFGYNLIDTSLGQLGLAIKASEPTDLFFVIKWDKDIDFYINEGDLMIPVKVRLCLGTGSNFIARNISDFDTDSTQYLINLYKLKNSDSGATGHKLFDIFTFYPGKTITFDVSITNPANYGNVALQLFDPISVGEALFDVANDVVNLELNNLSDSFIGGVTRNAWYQNIISNKVAVSPDFSRHVGRFVAVNLSTGMYDTAIIESYTPNASDIYSGGTFALTGEF